MRQTVLTAAVFFIVSAVSGVHAQDVPPAATASPEAQPPPPAETSSTNTGNAITATPGTDNPNTGGASPGNASPSNSDGQQGPPVSETPAEADRDTLLDRTQQGLHGLVSGSAKRVDSWFGGDETDPRAYEKASGSVAPALLWDEFEGFKPRLRFRANFPLPHISEKFDAFVGRVNRDEYVTERAQESGAFRRQYGPVEDDQTLLGISYRETPRQGGRFDAGAGIRLRFPLDPYVKGSYLYRKGELDKLMFSIRETVFWQNSENLGLTNRFDFERLLMEQWLVRFTGSATVSQETEGMRGYSTVSAVRGFPSRRAVTLEVGLDGETEADVPLHDYGFKLAYRQALTRNWLVLEIRTSLRWPKEELDQTREASWGVGAGFEMFFGTDEFLARPVTF